MAENAANNNKNGDANMNGEPNNMRTSSEEEIKLLKNNHVVIETPNEIDGGGGEGVAVGGGENGDLNKNEVAVAVIGEDLTDSNRQSYKLMNNKKKKNVFRGLYERLLTNFEITKKAESPFLILTIMCLLLVLVLLILIIVWPRVPSYYKKDVCVESECVEASKQLLSWSEVNSDPCENPYKWSCGKFESEYQSHKFYGLNKGEWNYNAHREYEEISAINEFISKLPTGAMSYSAQTMIKELHSYCTNLEILDSADAKLSLKKAYKSIGGWKLLREEYSPHWDIRKYLPVLQYKYGASPFFKISIANRNAPPFDNIIMLSEGDLGLPNKEFYDLDHRHPIIKAYHTLLQDILSYLVATSTEQNRLFAENMFQYEKRIAKNIVVTVRHDNSTNPQIKTMKDVIKEAPSLPILDTVKAFFKNKKITEHTPVIVENLEVLRSISQIVSSTEPDILNSFLAWSLTREFLPYMSRDYRVSLEEFHRVLYGVKAKEPIWYYCTKLVQKWLPFGLEALRQNPSLIVYDAQSQQPYSQSDNYQSEPLVTKKISYDDELAKMIFYHIRNEYRSAVTNAYWLNEKYTKYLVDKLTNLKLQIGIPNDILKSDHFINQYYMDFSLQKIQFVDNGEQYWNFQKAKMEQLLDTMNVSQKIVAELFPPCKTCEEKMKNLKYSINMNMVILSREMIKEPYFHHQYPISVNFARLGSDISAIIHEAVYLMSKQYEKLDQPLDLKQNIVQEQAENCIGKNINHADNKISNDTILKMFLTLSSGNMVAQSLNTFLNKVDKNEPIYDSHISELVNYNMYDFKQGKRQPGLRKFDEQQLFTMAFMQRHCAVIEDDYKKFKILIEDDIPEKEKYGLLWNNIPNLRKSLECSSSKTKCDNLL